MGKNFIEEFNKRIKEKHKPIYETAMTFMSSSQKFCVIDVKGDIIVPFRKYIYISPFRHGLARVKTGTSDMGHRIYDGSSPTTDAFVYKWGIIDNKGNEVVLPTYDYIRGFDKSRQESTPAVKGGQECIIRLRGLSKEYDDFLDSPNDISYDDNGQREWETYDDNGPRGRDTYNEYSGTYAQDIEGYSDQIINEAFDGEPEAYWNID